MNFVNEIFNKNSEFYNCAFCDILKYSSNEVIITDEKFNIIFHNSSYSFKNNKFDLSNLTKDFFNQNLVINFENFKNSEKNHIYFKLIFNDKNVNDNIPIDVHICKIRNNKKQIKGYSIIIKDITQEIRNKIQKETFIDILTHDLKNPIRAIIQVLELVIKNKFGVVDSNLKAILDELLDSCKFMNYMTDNLLIKYKNEFEMYELQKQKCSIVNLVKEKCNNLSNIFERKKQTIEFIVKGKIQDIYIDINEIGKVINNLIINASEQSSENSKIKICIESDNNSVNVSFIDFGCPKETQHLSEIFEEFITCSNKYRKIGFSLELYNCRKVIEAHNGRISAKNYNNQGTAITFSLPLYC